jgi:hypothetical protein
MSAIKRTRSPNTKGAFQRRSIARLVRTKHSVNWATDRSGPTQQHTSSLESKQLAEHLMFAYRLGAEAEVRRHEAGARSDTTRAPECPVEADPAASALDEPRPNGRAEYQADPADSESAKPASGSWGNCQKQTVGRRELARRAERANHRKGFSNRSSEQDAS